MAERRQKLELTWIDKDKRPRLEPRILLDAPSLSHHATKRIDKSDIFDNLLVHGDNLLALKALEASYSGSIKCIYIDPPFNTGQAFEHYDDGVQHSLWLSLMRDRIELLARLMHPEGSIWVHCDDNEQAYLKVVMDEVLGRSSFVATVVWQARYSRSNDASLSLSHNFILVYAKNPLTWRSTRNRLSRSDDQSKQYKNPDNDPRGPWRAIPWDAPGVRANLEYRITTPSGRVCLPPPGRHWSRTEDQWNQIVADGLAYFGKNGAGVPAFKQFLSEAASIVPNTWWTHEECGHTDEAKKEAHALFGKENAFATPKPERLLERVISIATNPGDLVLDSFAGSGTTGAVAHKMRRRWIMIELGDHAHTHARRRLAQVVDGADPGGVTTSQGWTGGGGFRFYRLAPSLLEKDTWGNWVVSKSFNAAMLAEAMCKLEGFRYEPDPETFWVHGRSTESDFLYVTTQNLSRSQLQFISEQVGPNRTLLVCCGAFRAKRDDFPNLTLKKIPQAVLHRCEWGRDDYSLNVQALPPVEATDEPAADGDGTKGSAQAPTGTGRAAKRPSKKPARGMQQLPLFDGARKEKGKR